MKELVTKYAQQFNANSTVREVSETLIINEPQLTANKAAELVQLIFEEYGIRRATTAACIAWYKNKMRQDNDKSKTRVQFKNYIDSLGAKERNKILLELASKYQDVLFKSLTDKDMVIPKETVAK